MKKYFSKFAFVAIALLGIGLMASTTEAGQNVYAYVAKNYILGGAQLLQTDAGGSLLTANGAETVLNVSASSVLSVGVGRIATISVLSASGVAGAIYDSATAASAVSANEIAVIPATVGLYKLDMPVTKGIVFIPGASQVISASFN